MALVSIVMPTYERAHLIGEAVDSALAQTFGDFVLLIGDNSESDATEKLIGDYDDPRIRYHRNRPALTANDNWVNLIQQVETPYVATLHDDDFWEPTFLQKMIAPFSRDPEMAMAYCDFWIVDKDGLRLDELTVRESARTRRSVTPTGPLKYDQADGLRLVAVHNAAQPAYAALVRTSDAQAMTVPDDVEPLYDIWLTYCLIKDRRGIYYINERLTNYRVHSGSATSGGFGPAEDAVFRRILAENTSAGPVLDEIRQYWASLQWARGTRLMDSAATRSESQRELAAAAPNLTGARRLLAVSATRFALLWHIPRLVRMFKRRFLTPTS